MNAQIIRIVVIDLPLVLDSYPHLRVVPIKIVIGIAIVILMMQPVLQRGIWWINSLWLFDFDPIL